MVCSLEFTGSVKVPSPSLGLGAGSSSKELLLQFAVNPRQFDRVVSTDCPFAFDSTSDFASMPLSDEMVTVEFVVFAVLLNGTIELLIGDLPTIQGKGGTFPTGFSGGETFTYLVETYDASTGAYVLVATVATVFTSGAQTAAAVANEINAAAHLANATSCKAVTVDASGQLVLVGPKPGADARITITVGNATIGLAGIAPASARGIGDPIDVNGNFVAELVAIPGTKLWLKGNASVNILLAGT